MLSKILKHIPFLRRRWKGKYRVDRVWYGSGNEAFQVFERTRGNFVDRWDYLCSYPRLGDAFQHAESEFKHRVVRRKTVAR